MGGVEGVAAAAEHFVHRVLTDHLTSAGQSHRYRIRYQHDTAQAQWYVDAAKGSSAQAAGVGSGIGRQKATLARSASSPSAMIRARCSRYSGSA